MKILDCAFISVKLNKDKNIPVIKNTPTIIPHKVSV
jgi:hypothetical protein